MITANDFIAQARARGFDFYTGVPCSFLTPLINGVIAAPGLAYVGAASEGEAVAIAAGAWLAGRQDGGDVPELRPRQRGQSADLAERAVPHPDPAGDDLARPSPASRTSRSTR